jgi:transcriptional regulator with XRE-family HTH domain
MTKDQARQAIRDGCRIKRWTVLDLSKRSKVSPEAIRRFMSGQGEISSRVMNQLLKTLDIDTN